MISLFFDCEFTRLMKPDDVEPPDLISIGAINEDGEHRFYAENQDFQVEQCSVFVKETVLPLLEGGDVCMSYAMTAKQLCAWIEAFDDGSGEPNVKMWTDSPNFDWMHIKIMFDKHGWPTNLVQKPIALAFLSSIQTQRFKAAVEDIFRTNTSLRRHHALDDALVNRLAFKRATARRY